MLNTEQFDENGFTIINNVITDDIISNIIHDLNQISCGRTIKQRENKIYAIRGLLNLVPSIRRLINSANIKAIIESIIKEYNIVRGIYFDKIPKANWRVDWHQDLTIAVKQRIDVEGYSSWTIKSGIPHAIPPIAILERMITLRLHLDNMDESNGALFVLPGSHKHGRLADDEIEKWKNNTPIICSAPKGSALIMRPLLLHASYAGIAPVHRRVLHIEFSPDILPEELEWYGA
jgi:ectoine hydroxylase-related dioxygenase (phytanoyl-CoA dioxygenase family)